MENPISATIAAYLFLAMVQSGIVTAVICFFLNLFVMPFFKAKALSRAQSEGHVIEAKKYDAVLPKGNVDIGGRHADFWGYYRYTYEGKTYKYVKRFVVYPPMMITLYFKKNPRKAKCDEDFGLVEHEWKPIFLVLVVIFFIGIAISRI